MLQDRSVLAAWLTLRICIDLLHYWICNLFQPSLRLFARISSLDSAEAWDAYCEAKSAVNMLKRVIMSIRKCKSFCFLFEYLAVTRMWMAFQYKSRAGS